MKQRERYEDWMGFAFEDLEMAKLAFKEGIYNQACFHSQQSVEKSLKALIRSTGSNPPRIHNLSELYTLISTPGVAQHLVLGKSKQVLCQIRFKQWLL